jgi:hypothetical protein
MEGKVGLVQASSGGSQLISVPSIVAVLYAAGGPRVGSGEKWNQETFFICGWEQFR